MTATTQPVTALRPVTPSGILAARLHDLHQRLAAREGVDPDLTAAMGEVTELATGLDPYLSDCTTAESPALSLLAQRTRAANWSRHRGAGSGPLEPEMLSGHVEGQTLKFLVHLARARRVLDIGMFTGYSALAMAEAVPEGGTVVACEVDPYVAQFAQSCFDDSPVGHRITVRVGPALATLKQLSAAGELFDVIFIDADKAGYTDYLNTVLDRGLLSPQGVVCVDNTLMQGEPYTSGEPTANGRAIAAFNQTLVRDRRVEQVLLPLRDGLTLVRRTGSA